MFTCRLCNGSDVSLIHKGTRDRSDVDVLKCNLCGLVFLSQVATDDSYYADGQMMPGVDFDRWRKNSFADDSRRFTNFKHLIQDKTILDFGCGNGGFLKLAHGEWTQSGLAVRPRRLVGVDLDKESVRRIQNDGIECYGDIRELPDIKFDVIFLFHVVEHLADPGTILCALADHLSDGGIIVIETPNADDALLSIYHCDKFADFTYWSPHICLYNEQTLRQMLEKAGFEVKDMLQEQRYPLANHLRWLAKGLPGGGVVELQELNAPEVNAVYAQLLRKQKACDTLVCMASKRASGIKSKWQK